MSEANDGGRSNLNTPSTSATSPQQEKPKERPSEIKPIAGDLNQWIKKPQGLGILGQQIVEQSSQEDDPVSIYQKLGKREINILNDYLNMWTRSIGELLQKLKDTIPKDGMIGEIHYWRDIQRVLDAINTELKVPYVETVAQILA